MKSVLTAFLALCFCDNSHAQIDGDNIFSVDQIISIDLAFPQDDFWGDLQTHYAADENEYIPAMLTLTDVSGTHIMDSVGVRLKGNSSYSHPGVKKSFKIDFNKYISGQNYDGLKKLNFSNGFKDPTCMREKLFFDACKDAGVPAPRTSFANVTFNGEAWGFYTVVEQIDDQFLDWAIEEDSGNLFKAGDNFGGGGPGGGGGGNNTAADLADYGTDPAVYADRYELKTNEDVNDWSDLISFIDFINNTDLDAFAAGIDFRMDVDGFFEVSRVGHAVQQFGQLHRVSSKLLHLPQPRIQPLGMDQVGRQRSVWFLHQRCGQHGNIGDRLRQSHTPLARADV